MSSLPWGTRPANWFIVNVFCDFLVCVHTFSETTTVSRPTCVMHGNIVVWKDARCLVCRNERQENIWIKYKKKKSGGLGGSLSCHLKAKLSFNDSVGRSGGENCMRKLSGVVWEERVRGKRGVSYSEHTMPPWQDSETHDMLAFTHHFWTQLRWEHWQHACALACLKSTHLYRPQHDSLIKPYSDLKYQNV